MTAARKLSADTVCAYVWALVDERLREALCAIASVNSLNAIMDWYELGPGEQAALRVQLADLIEHNASRQRAEWCKQAERMKRAAA